MEDNYKYDEDEAVKFIRRSIPVEVNEQYTNDEILFIIDTIWDYYERIGLTSLDGPITEEEELDVEKLTDYVKKQVSNDRELIMDPADIDKIVKAELDYEESLEDFI